MWKRHLEKLHAGILLLSVLLIYTINKYSHYALKTEIIILILKYTFIIYKIYKKSFITAKNARPPTNTHTFIEP